MAIIKYPYTNLHELNLDWIIEQLDAKGYVLTVNDKHGIVVLTGSDIARTTSNPETIADALATQGTSIQAVRTQIGTTALPTIAQTITGAIAENAGEIANIQDDVIGSTPLPTTAQTLTGAIAENAGEIANLEDDVIGSTALPTTAQTLTGAIAELNTKKSEITAIDINIINDSGIQINTATSGAVKIDNFISAYVIDSNSIAVVPYTYSNLMYVTLKNVSDMSTVSAGDYKVRVWYKKA